MRALIHAAAVCFVRLSVLRPGSPARSAAVCQGENQSVPSAVSGSSPVSFMVIIRNSSLETGCSGRKHRVMATYSPESRPFVRRKRASRSLGSPVISAKTPLLTLLIRMSMRVSGDSAPRESAAMKVK